MKDWGCVALSHKHRHIRARIVRYSQGMSKSFTQTLWKGGETQNKQHMFEAHRHESYRGSVDSGKIKAKNVTPDWVWQ